MEEVAIYQRGVSREVANIHSWVSVMVKTSDSKERDNAVNCYPSHALCYPSDPRHIVDAQLDESHIEASEV